MSTEYITRGAEPKPHYIDINAFLASENVNNVYGDYWELKEKLEAIPAADVEPVVRCRTCRRWESTNGRSGTCPLYGGTTLDNYFCASGALDERSDA